MVSGVVHAHSPRARSLTGPRGGVSMTGILWVPRTKEQMGQDEELDRLLKEAAAKPMTAEDHYRQRRSWLIGEMGLEHPEWPQEQLEQFVDDALARQGY